MNQHPAQETARSIIRLLFAVCLAVASPSPILAEPIAVHFVFDGPGRTNPMIESITREEILALTRGEMEVTFPETIHGDWTAEGIAEAVDRALAAEESDLVVTFGLLSSDSVARRGPLPKPVVAAAVIDARRQGLPTAAQGPGGEGLGGVGSGTENLVYIELPTTIVDELKAFYSVVPFDKIAFFGNRSTVRGLPQLSRRVEEEARGLGLEVQIVEIGARVDEAFDQLEPDVDAVYVWPQFQLGAEQFQELVDGLIERGLPSFSSLGRIEVEAGLLTAQRGADLIRRVARRAALNVQRILLGEPAAEIPVGLTLRDELSINMATARDLGIDPRWETLIEARLIHADEAQEGPPMRLAEAVREAVERNLDLAVRRRVAAASEQGVEIARAAWRPSVEAGVTALRIDDDRAAASFGSQAEQSVTTGLSVSQLLVSDGAAARVDVERSVSAADRAGVEITRLDVALESAVTYLNLLRARTRQRIQRNNLELTRSNLELAEVRRRVGTANPAEIYRWQSQIARDRQALVDAAADVEVTESALNRLLHRPLEEPVHTVEVGLDDRDLLVDLEDFQSFIATPRHFQLVCDFNVEKGLDASPEISALEHSLEIQERLASAARRAFYWPTVAAQFSLDHVLDRSGAGSESTPLPGATSADDTSWSLALNASLPVFSGGERRAERIRAEEDLARAELELEAGREQLAQTIRAASVRARASYFGTRLAEEAAEAARRSRELVADAYGRGAVSILDLLDAQNAALNADLAAGDAVYDFLIDLLTLERATGFFYMLEPADDQDRRIEDLRAYFISAGVEPWSPSPLDVRSQP